MVWGYDLPPSSTPEYLRESGYLILSKIINYVFGRPKTENVTHSSHKLITDVECIHGNFGPRN